MPKLPVQWDGVDPATTLCPFKFHYRPFVAGRPSLLSTAFGMESAIPGTQKRKKNVIITTIKENTKTKRSNCRGHKGREMEDPPRGYGNRGCYWLERILGPALSGAHPAIWPVSLPLPPNLLIFPLFYVFPSAFIYLKLFDKKNKLM